LSKRTKSKQGNQGEPGWKGGKHAYLYSTIAGGETFLAQKKVAKAPIKRKAIKKKAEKAVEPTWLTAVRAAEDKKAQDIKVLDLTGISSFTDFFVICTGSNTKQNQAISDEVALRMKKRREMPFSVEGYSQAEWVLTDYGDLVVHVLTPKARAYYDLERLWRDGKSIDIPAA
jgi:ribosome-associated protein